MNEHPHHWLKKFTLSDFASDCLRQTSSVFDFAREGSGSAYLRKRAEEYAEKRQLLLPPEKSLKIEFTSRYSDFEAIFIQAWPCLYLSIPPVHMAAVRIEGNPLCRIFRMSTPESGQLYLNELAIEESNRKQINVPSYRDASAIIFSYTLGTPCFRSRLAEEPWPEAETSLPQQSFTQ